MRLAAIPATVTDLVERLFVRCMVILLIARDPKGDRAASGLAKDAYCAWGDVDADQHWVRRRAGLAQASSHAPDVGFGSKADILRCVPRRRTCAVQYVMSPKCR